MGTDIASLQGVVRASRLEEPEIKHDIHRFSFSNFRGRLVEFVVSNGSPVITAMSGIIREAQQQCESVIWISSGDSSFYPPDYLENGIEIETLPVVWAGEQGYAIRATEHLLRSGSFGLLVVDLQQPGDIKPGALGTLNRLAALHNAAVVFLNTPEALDCTLGSLISLRFTVSLVRRSPNVFACIVHAVKDKKIAQGWVYEEHYNGTDGLY